MTVIAWDGKTLAADKLCNFQNLASETIKVFKTRIGLIATSGYAAKGAEMRHWLIENEGLPEYMPEFQKDEDKCVHVLVITPSGKILKYESSAFPIIVNDKFHAIGSGRDYAMAAMHLGCSAVGAVQVASIFDIGCGLGVDFVTLED